MLNVGGNYDSQAETLKDKGNIYEYTLACNPPVKRVTLATRPWVSILCAKLIAGSFKLILVISVI